MEKPMINTYDRETVRWLKKLVSPLRVSNDIIKDHFGHIKQEIYSGYGNDHKILENRVY